MGRKSPTGHSPSRNEWGLTEKQEAFAQHYAKHGNLGEAYRIAYPGSGGKANWQRCEALRLLKNPDIALRVDMIRDSLARAGSMEVDELVARMTAIADFDSQQVFASDGSVRPMADWPEHARKIVTQFEVLEYFEGFGPNREQVGVIKKVKFASRERCLEMLGRYRKMFGQEVANPRKRLEDMTLDELDAFIASRKEAQALIERVGRRTAKVVAQARQPDPDSPEGQRRA